MNQRIRRELVWHVCVAYLDTNTSFEKLYLYIYNWIDNGRGHPCNVTSHKAGLALNPPSECTLYTYASKVYTVALGIHVAYKNADRIFPGLSGGTGWNVCKIQSHYLHCDISPQQMFATREYRNALTTHSLHDISQSEAESMLRIMQPQYPRCLNILLETQKVY